MSFHYPRHRSTLLVNEFPFESSSSLFSFVFFCYAKNDVTWSDCHSPLMVALLLLLVIEFLFCRVNKPGPWPRWTVKLILWSRLIPTSYSVFIYSLFSFASKLTRRLQSTKSACIKPNKCQRNSVIWHFQEWESIKCERESAFRQNFTSHCLTRPIENANYFPKKNNKILRLWEAKNRRFFTLRWCVVLWNLLFQIEPSVTKFAVQFSSISNLFDGYLQWMAR